MNAARLWTIARLELLQRVRTVSWYVLLGVFALLLVGVTALAYLAYGGWGQSGPGIYSVVVCVTLLLVLLVSPTLSGNSINGDRDAATLAPVQVTLVTTGEILLGKFVAGWITGLAFAAVAAPFLVIATPRDARHDRPPLRLGCRGRPGGRRTAARRGGARDAVRCAGTRAVAGTEAAPRSRARPRARSPRTAAG